MSGHTPPDEILDRLGAEINSSIGPSHKYHHWIGNGATGLVVAVEEQSLGHGRAMKILRPGISEMNSTKVHRSFADIFAAEIEQMASVTHQNVVRIYSKGSLKQFHDPLAPFTNDDAYDSPYYLMELVEGDDLDKYMYKNIATLSSREMKDIIIQIVEGLAGIHQAKVLHGDVKPANIVITKQGSVKITDFGFAKSLARSDSACTFWCQDPGWLHPELKWLLLKQGIDQPSETRSIIEVDNAELKRKGIQWELHSLGKTIEWIRNLIYNYDHDRKQHRISTADREFLRLVADRLIDNRSDSDWESLPRSDSYTSSEQVLVDLKKLSRSYGLGGDALEFGFQLRRVIQPPLSRPIAFTKRLQSLIDHPLFQRLHDVSQLGVVGLAFRAARHSRFEHSEGVLCLAVDYLKALWSNANSAYFRQAASERDCELFLVGALLHDLGQYPFAHAFEESETQKQLFSHELLTERLILAQLTTDIVDQSQLNLFDEAGADYWSALDKLLRDSKGRYVFDIISDEWGLDPSDVVSLLGSGRVGEALSYPSKVVDTLRDAINGPIDVDKVDYIRRDSYHLGFPARLDVYGLIGDLAVSDRNGQMRLTISEGGVPAAQDLHVARYRLFTDVYWDRVSRSAERMLRYSVDTLRSLLGDEEFSRIFFLKVLTNSDTPLIEALKHEAYSYSGTEMGKMRGCVEILDRVQRRNLHLEGTVLDASRDEKQHKVLCEMWVNALKTSDGEDAFRSLTSWVRKSIGDKLSRPVAEHEVFFDIPHASTDQPSKYDVYVHSRNGEARSISEFSPMWRSFSDMFKLHGRKVRLFVAPELWDLIDEKICRSAIEDALGRRGSKKAGHS